MRYDWTGWEAETELGNPDDRERVLFLTITEDEEEFAVIIHRETPGLDNLAIEEEKERHAQLIVDALNAFMGAADADEEN